MKFISDFFSLLLFFAVYLAGEQFPEAAHRLATTLLGGITRGGVIPEDQASILLAIAVAIVAFTIQIAWLLVRRRKISVVQWLSFAILVLFGGASIYFHSDTFIKWKVTVLYWMFAVALFCGTTFFGKNFIRSLMEPGGIELPDRLWKRMNDSWMLFFAGLGALNLLVAFNVSRTTWVTFKSFGLTALTVVFALVQGLMISRHLDRIEADEARSGGNAANDPVGSKETG